MHELSIGKLTLATALSIFLATGLATESTNASEGVSYKIVGEGIRDPLTSEPGDVKRGKAVYMNCKQGNCLACHVTTDLKDQPFHGNVGPPMDGVASRYSAAELRLRIANPKVVNEDTIMPAFYRTDGFHRVLKKFKGKTVLSAQDVEDIIAYLMTMKDE